MREFTRNVLVLASGTALGQAVGILASPVLTRLYTPGDFGVLGVFVSLSALLSVVVTLRYELAIPLPSEDDSAAGLVMLSLVVIPVTAATTAVAVWLLRASIVRWTGSPALGAYLWLLPVGMIFLGGYQVFNYWAIRMKAFGGIARAKLNQGIARVITQLVLFPFGPFGLLLGEIMRSVVGGTTLALIPTRAERTRFRSVALEQVGRVAARYRRFPEVSTWSGLVNSAGTQLPLLILATFHGPFVAGQFALVQRVVTWPAALVGTSVAQAYFGAGALALRDSPAVLPRLFMRISLRLAAIAMAVMVILMTLGPWLFPVVFGTSWRPAGQYVRILGPMVAVQLVAGSLSHTFNMIERQTWQLGWDVFRLVLVIGSLGIAVHLHWSAVGAIAVYASTMFVGYLVLWSLQAFGVVHVARTRAVID